MTEATIRRLGIYRVLYASNVQYNSILFRIIVGVTGGLPVKAVALVSFLEFFLLTVLELPTGRLADRFGRVPLSVAGFILTAGSLVSLFFALQFSHDTALATGLLVIDGILLGIGRPLFSGAVEAFYQDAIARKVKEEGAAASLELNSFTLSNRHGRYISTAAVFAAFLSLALLNRTGVEHYLFLIGAAVYLGIAAMLIRDLKLLGDFPEVTPSQSVATLAKQVFTLRRSLFASVVNLTSSMYGIAVMGYLIVSMGRGIPAGETYFFYLCLASFMFGYVSFGWILKAHVLPNLIERLTEKSYLSLLYSVLLVPSAALWFYWGNIPYVGYPVILAVYGILIQVVMSGTKDISTNMVLEPFSRNNYATVASLSNLPSFAWVWIYDLYLLGFTATGVPSMEEIFLTVSAVSLLGLAAVSVYYALPVESKTESRKALWTT
jgi:MFS family permease